MIEITILSILFASQMSSASKFSLQDAYALENQYGHCAITMNSSHVYDYQNQGFVFTEVGFVIKNIGMESIMKMLNAINKRFKDLFNTLPTTDRELL